MVRLLSATVILLIFVEPAYAYLDPGTGSILLQGLIAAIAGTMVTGGMYWRKIKNIFSSNKEKHEQQVIENKVDD